MYKYKFESKKIPTTYQDILVVLYAIGSYKEQNDKKEIFIFYLIIILMIIFLKI